jgi:DNA-binding PadR family transcriptional regulator
MHDEEGPIWAEDEEPGPRGWRHGGPHPGPEWGPRAQRVRRKHMRPDFPMGPPPRALAKAFPGGPEFRMGPGPWHEGREGRGRRARRGDVRAAVLALLAEEPRNGYQIIQEIGERSGGVWRPSPGSVYPALQQLEDEELVRTESGESGRRLFALTDEGRSYVAGHPDEVRAPWDVVAGRTGGAAIEMRRLVRQVGMAAFQVVSAGSDAQQTQARQVLADCRRSLYRILAAEDDEADTSDSPSSS